MRRPTDTSGEDPCLLFRKSDTDHSDGMCAHEASVGCNMALRLDPSLCRCVCRIFKIVRIADNAAYQSANATRWPIKCAQSLLDPDLKARGEVLRKVGELIRNCMIPQIGKND